MKIIAAPPRSPAALFPLYQPVNGQAVDDGRCVKSAGRPNGPHPQVEIISQSHSNVMTFLEQFERALRRMLESGDADTADIVRWASEKVLESYRNGITTGLQGARVKPQGANLP